MDAVNVICVKWGSKYGSDYVNKLHSMVRRNMTRPFRFVCFTDDTDGIAPDIECKGFPALGVADFDNRAPWTLAHGWLKVATFAAPLDDLVGPTLCLDLDIVITDSLDPFFDLPGEFIVINEWDKKDATGNTSTYRFEAGAHGDLLEHLGADVDAARNDHRNEQEFVTQYFARTGKLSYWPAAWCVSFKRHCMKGSLLGWMRGATIPDQAKVVVFHGKPNPPDAIAGISGKWYRRVRPVKWVEELWR